MLRVLKQMFQPKSDSREKRKISSSIKHLTLYLTAIQDENTQVSQANPVFVS